MQRVSTYRLIALAVLWAGVALQSKVTTVRAQHLSTGVLSQFPTRLGAFEGADVHSPYAEAVRKSYSPAVVVVREYTGGGGEPIQTLIGPDIVGAHAQDICTRYSGWKVLQQTSGVLRGVPVVKLTRTVETSPQTPGYDAGFMVCDQYWREQKRGLSEEESKSLFLRRGFCFRVLMCTEIQSPAEASAGFAKLDAFAAAADPVVCQFLQKADAE